MIKIDLDAPEMIASVVRCERRNEVGVRFVVLSPADPIQITIWRYDDDMLVHQLADVLHTVARKVVERDDS